MTTRKKTVAKVALVAGGVLALAAAPFVLGALILVWVWTSGDIPHRADAELIDNFRAHRAEFDRLLGMVHADEKLLRVDVDWTSPENPQEAGVSPERVEEYRRMFRKLGVRRGFNAFGGRDYVEFMTSAKGLSIGGSAKGYAYSTRRPELIVDDLDRHRARQTSSFTAYRHIEGDWYLFFNYED